MAKKCKRKRPEDEHRQRSPEPQRRNALDKIREPDRAYSRIDLPRGSTFSCLQVDPRKRKDIKEGKIEYLTPLKTSAGNVFLKIEDRQLLPRPPRQKTSHIKRDMSKFYQYHNDHGNDTDDFRYLKIEIENLIQPGQLKDYNHKETESVNRRFDQERSESLDGLPIITARVNVISGGRSGRGDSGSARWV
ncbi:hypothetical protein LIER_14201 [Lithospermum erythrorhizon]|uniref:Uncharacterized protein n=1 Tax=Lithospermum erythrorhizon TaxID=34254 RepID=A0AAV3Q0K5_LITER